MFQLAAIPSIPHLPRLRTVLSEVLGVPHLKAQLDLDLAEALACDEHDRNEVVVTMDVHYGIAIREDEVEACETVADLLRLVAAKHGLERRLYN
jgi:acyl carrier protein